LKEVLIELKQKFGTWQMAWGEINRFQRLTGKIQETFDDNQPSLPVGFLFLNTSIEYEIYRLHHSEYICPSYDWGNRTLFGADVTD
jgi:acyl-homoserine lactone acylase PvdQ